MNTVVSKFYCQHLLLKEYTLRSFLPIFKSSLRVHVYKNKMAWKKEGAFKNVKISPSSDVQRLHLYSR